MTKEQLDQEAYNIGRNDFFYLHPKRSDEENYVRGYDEAEANWQRRFARHTLGEQMTTSKPKEQRTVAEVLSVIEECLAVGNATSQDLWRVLTALRGPDNGDDSMKTCTTAIIRDKAFPTLLGTLGTSTSPYINGAVFNKDSHVRASRRGRIRSLTNSHFIGHASRAFGVLGLKWDEFNKE